MTTHIPGPLCGSNSFTATVNSADCERCNSRLNKLLQLLADVAEGKNRQKEAEKLMKQWRFSKTTDINVS